MGGQSSRPQTGVSGALWTSVSSGGFGRVSVSG
jgi:hypothetical protein